MSSKQKWADTPFPLVTTPSFTKPISDHPAHHIANEMAFAHNAMIRGLNAIYQQAPHIPSSPSTISAFLFLIRSWAAWILDHHVLEETLIFPGFERVPGVPASALTRNVEQHHAFSKGMEKLEEYAKTVQVEEYDGAKVCAMLDPFAGVLCEHLRDEIATLWSLECVQLEHAGRLLEVWREGEKKAETQDKAVVPPMVLGLRDTTFEGGNDWPKMPPGSAFIVNWVFGWKYAESWTFLPCDVYGRPRALRFLGDE
ncbi:hypothetical protein EJ04DRAFT_553823 [Polyplosphaeria fusca]|uniref:Hemerythrin-like domain-containing protein n=1 Tax=Polyplosphaeria fusca TaxID=682080 RepID=A0A9P4QS55_9PLEO|nr:hypothetical protein EJ04DRAFT_553823 [Polyplosphaeria fusca]